MYEKHMKTVYVKGKLLVLFTYEKNVEVCPFKKCCLESLNQMLNAVYILYENQTIMPRTQFFL